MAASVVRLAMAGAACVELHDGNDDWLTRVRCGWPRNQLPSWVFSCVAGDKETGEEEGVTAAGNAAADEHVAEAGLFVERAFPLPALRGGAP